MTRPFLRYVGFLNILISLVESRLIVIRSKIGNFTCRNTIVFYLDYSSSFARVRFTVKGAAEKKEHITWEGRETGCRFVPPLKTL